MASSSGSASSDCKPEEAAADTDETPLSKQSIQRVADELREEMMVAILGQLQGTASICAEICMERLSLLQADLERRVSEEKRRVTALIEEVRGSLVSQGMAANTIGGASSHQIFTMSDDCASDGGSDLVDDLDMEGPLACKIEPGENIKSDDEHVPRETDAGTCGGKDDGKDGTDEVANNNSETPSLASQLLVRERDSGWMGELADVPLPSRKIRSEAGDDAKLLEEVSDCRLADDTAMDDASLALSKLAMRRRDRSSRKKDGLVWENPLWEPRQRSADTKGNQRWSLVQKPLHPRSRSSSARGQASAQGMQSSSLNPHAREIRSILIKACPGWTLQELSQAEFKLKQIQIDSPRSLRNISYKKLKEKLLAAGLKAFKKETIVAIWTVMDHPDTTVVFC